MFVTKDDEEELVLIFHREKMDRDRLRILEDNKNGVVIDARDYEVKSEIDNGNVLSDDEIRSFYKSGNWK